jgi:hypothetical protein
VSPEQWTALLVALGAILAAFAAVLTQVVALRRQVNGRLEQLLEQTRVAAQHRGELEGRDWQKGQASSSSESSSSS